MAEQAEVVIYTRQLCGYCTAAKNLLSSKGIEFTEKDASFDPALRQEMIGLSHGATTFPQIFIGEVHVGGCDDLMMMERSGKLDGLLREQSIERKAAGS